MGILGKCLQLVVVISVTGNLYADDTTSMWQDQAKTYAKPAQTASSNTPNNARWLSLNTQAMQHTLIAHEPLLEQTTVQEKSSTARSIELPLPNGENIHLTLTQTNVLPPQLASRYPMIKTYKVAQPSGRIMSGRVDFTYQGFHAMLVTYDGQTIFIDPEHKGTTNTYLSYRKSDQPHEGSFQCNTPEHHHHPISPFQNRASIAARSAGGMMEYRIAVAATAEYTQRHGGRIESALSAITTTISRINQVYEKSFGVRLSLVENNDKIIYTDANTDPYSNFHIDLMLEENQQNLDKVIGSDYYDIGHVFGTSGGGLAYIGSLCKSDRKAMGASGVNSPYGDGFSIDYVAHELGHQFGATHTFNSNQGVCTAASRTNRTAFEPGSGSSIMSYAGGCGSDNLQLGADAMFHSGNIEQVNNTILSNNTRNCGVERALDNQPPVVFAGNSHTIPAHTPFELTAIATDANLDPLSYSWEQRDAGTSSTLNTDTGDNPLFRILPPVSSPSRSFPSMKTLLGTDYIKGETLPQTQRTLLFQVAVYDGQHAPSMDQVKLSVINTGSAFSLNKPQTAYAQGSNISITWNPAGTAQAPINCHAVDLQLSIDAGQNFSYLLASGLVNDGIATVHIPNTIPDTAKARFKLSCANNIFFTISSQNFAIGRNLAIPESNTRIPNNPANSLNTTKGGGGSISALFLFLLGMVILFKKQTLT